MIRSTNSHAKIVLHRDRDFLDSSEIEDWKKEVRAIGVEPFVTTGRDVESYFINAEYLAEFNPEVTQEGLEDLIEEVLSESKDRLVQDFVNGRVEIIRRAGKAGSVNHGQLAVEGKNAVAKNPRNYAGKSIFKALRASYQKHHGMNLSGGSTPSAVLSDGTLASIAAKLPKAK